MDIKEINLSEFEHKKIFQCFKKLGINVLFFSGFNHFFNISIKLKFFKMCWFVDESNRLSLLYLPPHINYPVVFESFFPSGSFEALYKFDIGFGVLLDVNFPCLISNNTFLSFTVIDEHNICEQIVWQPNQIGIRYYQLFEECFTNAWPNDLTIKIIKEILIPVYSIEWKTDFCIYIEALNAWENEFILNETKDFLRKSNQILYYSKLGNSKFIIPFCNGFWNNSNDMKILALEKLPLKQRIDEIRKKNYKLDIDTKIPSHMINNGRDVLDKLYFSQDDIEIREKNIDPWDKFIIEHFFDIFSKCFVLNSSFFP